MRMSSFSRPCEMQGRYGEIEGRYREIRMSPYPYPYPYPYP